MDIKEKIKESYISLVVEKKTIKISVKEIVERAQISRRSFYNYFPDRQAITEYIYIDTIEKTIKECFEKKYTTEMFITEVYRCFLEDKDFFVLAMNEDGQNSLTETIIERSQIVFSHLFKDIIFDKVRLEYLSYKYASSQVLLIQKWVKGGMKESPEFMTEVYLDSHTFYEDQHESIISKNTNW